MATRASETNAPVRLSVRAKPRAKQSRIVRADGLTIEVALAAPPADGAANRALVDLLAEVLSVPRRCLTLTLGGSSRSKVVELRELSAEAAMTRLARAAERER